MPRKATDRTSIILQQQANRISGSETMVEDGMAGGRALASYGTFSLVDRQGAEFDLHIALHGLQHFAQIRRCRTSYNCLANYELVPKSAIRHLVCKLVCFARVSTLCMHA